MNATLESTEDTDVLRALDECVAQLGGTRSLASDADDSDAFWINGRRADLF